MKRFAPLGRFVTTAILGLCLMGGVTRAADPVSGDKRLPQETLLHISIHNVDEFKEKYKNTQFGKLLQDDSMKEFIGQFEEPLKGISSEVEEKTGLPLMDILAIPSGEFTFSVAHSDPGPLSVILTLDYGKNEANVKKLIEKAAAAAKEADGTSSEEEVDGVTIVTLSPKSEEGSDDKADPANIQASFKGVSYATKDNTLLISNQASAIKGILERWAGSSDAVLANAPAYKAVAAKCAPKGDDPAELVWFVDPMGIVKSVVAFGATENPQLGMVMGFLPVLGFDQLKGLGGAMNVGEGDFDNVSRSFINVEQPPRGAMRLFIMPAAAQAPAKWVHDKSSMFTSMNWDLQETYKATESLFNTFAGEGALAKAVEDLAENEDGPKVHIKKDLVDQLTGKIIISGDVKEEDESSQERYVVAIELNNEDAFKKVLAKAAKFPAFPGKPREFEGHTIYELGLGGAMEEEESEEQSFRKLADDDEAKKDSESEDSEEEMEEEAEGLTAAIAIGRKHLFFGTDVEQIEQILRGKDEDALADSDVYKKISKFFPAKSSSISFQRADAQVKAALEALKSGQLDAVVGDAVDLSKLPDFESIEKYFTPTGGFLRPDDEGVYWETFNLKGE